MKKAEEYLKKMEENKSNDPHEKAKINVLTATSTLKEHVETA